MCFFLQLKSMKLEIKVKSSFYIYIQFSWQPTFCGWCLERRKKNFVNFNHSKKFFFVFVSKILLLFECCRRFNNLSLNLYWKIKKIMEMSICSNTFSIFMIISLRLNYYTELYIFYCFLSVSTFQTNTENNFEIMKPNPLSIYNRQLSFKFLESIKYSNS